FAFCLSALALAPGLSFFLPRTDSSKVTSQAIPSSEIQLNQKDGASSETSTRKLRAALLNLPLSFETGARENEFLAHGPGYALLLRPGESVLAVSRGAKKEIERPARQVVNKADFVSVRLAGANAAARGAGIDMLPGQTNYLLGNDPAKWRTNV